MFAKVNSIQHVVKELKDTYFALKSFPFCGDFCSCDSHCKNFGPRSGLSGSQV